MDGESVRYYVCTSQPIQSI